jgi:hypothetical protein
LVRIWPENAFQISQNTFLQSCKKDVDNGLLNGLDSDHYMQGGVMKQEHYTSTEIQKKARVSKSSLNNWIDGGVIEPWDDTRGRGKSRTFSHLNLLDVMVCRELSLFNLPPRVFPVILGAIKKEEAWDAVLNDPGVPVFIIVPLWCAFNAETGIYDSAAPFPKVIPTKSPEDLGLAVGGELSALTINLSALAEDVGGV